MGLLHRVPKEAIVQFQRAIELEPLNLQYNYNLGQGYQHARMYDLAIQQLNKTLEMDPNFFNARNQLAIVYFQMKSYDQWLAELKRAVALNSVPEDMVVYEATEHGYTQGGFRTAMEAQIKEQLRLRAKGSYVDPSSIAYNYAALGNKEQTLRWLETALAERARGLIFIKVIPELDPFHSEPRYKAVLAKMGLPE